MLCFYVHIILCCFESCFLKLSTHDFYFTYVFLYSLLCTRAVG